MSDEDLIPPHAMPQSHPQPPEAKEVLRHQAIQPMLGARRRPVSSRWTPSNSTNANKRVGGPVYASRSPVMSRSSNPTPQRLPPNTNRSFTSRSPSSFSSRNNNSKASVSWYQSAEQKATKDLVFGLKNSKAKSVGEVRAALKTVTRGLLDGVVVQPRTTTTPTTSATSLLSYPMLDHLDEYDYTLLINAAARVQDWRLALRLLRRIEDTPLKKKTKRRPTTNSSSSSAASKEPDAPSPLSAHSSSFSSSSSSPPSVASGEEEKKETSFLAPSVYHYSAAINACKVSMQQYPAMQLFEEMCKRGIKPNQHTYSSVVACCSDGQVARRRLQDMKKQGLSPDVYTWSAAIAACDRFGAKKTTQTMAAGGGGSTMMTSEGQGALALTFLEEMEEAGVPPNQYSYSSAIRAVSRDHSLPWNTALQLLGEMRRNLNVPPGVMAYSAAVAACGEAGRASEALQLLEEMNLEGVPPNEVTLNAAITACERGYQVESAVWLLEQMEAAQDTRQQKQRGGGQPQQQHQQQQSQRSVAATARAVAGRATSKSSSDYPDPTIVSYNAAISACKGVGQWRRALSLLKRVKDRGYATPDLITFNSCISACERGIVYGSSDDDDDDANDKSDGGSGSDDDFGDEKWGLGDGGGSNEEEDVTREDAAREDLVKFGLYALGGDDSGEDDKWVSRWEAGWRSSDYTHSSYDTSNKKQQQQQEQDRELVRQRGGQDKDTKKKASKKYGWGQSTSSSSSSCLQLQAAVRLLGEAKQQGLKPNFITYSALLACCQKAGDGPVALKTLDDMQRCKVSPNMYSFAAVLGACEQSGHWRAAVGLLLRMRASSSSSSVSSSSSSPLPSASLMSTPGPSIYSSVCSTLARGQLTQELLQVLKLLRTDLPTLTQQYFQQSMKNKSSSSSSGKKKSSRGSMGNAVAGFGSESFDEIIVATQQQRVQKQQQQHGHHQEQKQEGVMDSTGTIIANPGEEEEEEVNYYQNMGSSRQRRGLSKKDMSQARSTALNGKAKEGDRSRMKNPRTKKGVVGDFTDTRDESSASLPSKPLPLFDGFGLYSDPSAAAEVAARASLEKEKGNKQLSGENDDADLLRSSSLSNLQTMITGRSQPRPPLPALPSASASPASRIRVAQPLPAVDLSAEAVASAWLDDLYLTLLDYLNADDGLLLLKDIRKEEADEATRHEGSSSDGVNEKAAAAVRVGVTPRLYSKAIEVCAESVGHASIVCDLVVDLMTNTHEHSITVPSVADFLHVVQAAEIDEDFVDMVDFGLTSLDTLDTLGDGSDEDLKVNDSEITVENRDGEERGSSSSGRLRQLEARAVTLVCSSVTAAARLAEERKRRRNQGGGGRSKFDQESDKSEIEEKIEEEEWQFLKRLEESARVAAQEAAQAVGLLLTGGNTNEGNSDNNAAAGGGVITALLRRLRKEANRVTEGEGGGNDVLLLPVQVYNNAFAACDRTEQFHDFLAAIVLMQQPLQQQDDNSVDCKADKNEEEGAALRMITTTTTTEPDKTTVEISNGLVAIYGRRHQWRGTLALVRDLSALGVPLTRSTYLSILSALEKAGRWQEALGQLEEMRGAGVIPDVVAYSTTISACEKGGSEEAWSKAVTLLEEMKMHGVEPNVVSYNAAISACAHGGRWLDALTIYEYGMLKKQEEGESDDDDSNNHKKNKTKNKNKNKKQVLPDAVTYSALFAALNTNQQLEVMDEVYDEALSRGVLWPWSRRHNNNNNGVMDLHSFSVPMATTAVREVLRTMVATAVTEEEKQQQEKTIDLSKTAAATGTTASLPEITQKPNKQQQQSMGELRSKDQILSGNDDLSAGYSHPPSQDLVIITGIGRGSVGGKSVIQPEVRRMLSKDFSLNAKILPGNRGRLVVSAKDLSKWLKAQLKTRADDDGDDDDDNEEDEDGGNDAE